MSIEVKLPELGENVEHGDVVNVLVSEGDTVSKGQNLVELETDKAVVEVPCTADGKVARILVKKGDRINIGDPILTLEPASPGATAPSMPEAAAAPAPAPVQQVSADTEPAPRVSPAVTTSDAPVRAAAAPTNGHKAPPAPAGPATRRLARKLGVDLYQVSGSGRGGRIVAEDVEAFVRGHLATGGMATSTVAA